MEAAAASRVGAGLLGEIEETSLDEILASLRTSLTTTTTTVIGGNIPNANPIPNTPRPKEFPFAPLNDLVHRHIRATQSAPLAVSGRHLPLLYALVATLIAPPHNKAVSVVDMDGRFDVTRIPECAPFPFPFPSPAAPLPSTVRIRPSDLDHVHVSLPARGGRSHVADAVAAAEKFMLYGRHGSRSREWWGTLVVGGGTEPVGGGGDVAVTAGWRGWLRVDRAEVGGFGGGGGVEEALAGRDGRAAAVDAAGWVAGSVWGGFAFGGEADGEVVVDRAEDPRDTR